MDNILELLKGQLTGPIVGQLTKAAGLSDGALSSSMIEKIIGVILAGLGQKAAAPGGADQIFGLINTLRTTPGMQDLPGNIGDILGSPAKATELGKKGTDLATAIFGGGLGNIVSILGPLLKMGSGALGPLMGLILPLLLGNIGKIVAGKGLNAAGLADLLKGQQGFLKDVVPPELAGQLGFAGLGNAAGKAADAVRTTTAAATRATAAVEAPGLPKWLVPALLGLLGLGLVYFLLPKGEEPIAPPGDTTAVLKTKPVEIQPPTAGAVVDAAKGAVVDAAKTVAAKLIPFKLPDGTALELPEGSFVDTFGKFVTGASPDLSQTWAFNVAEYLPNTTELTPAAKLQFDIFAKMLQAMPTLTVKLTGHSADATEAGTVAALAKADAVKKALTDRGVAAEKVVTESAGATKPVAPAGDPKNERLELGVIKL